MSHSFLLVRRRIGGDGLRARVEEDPFEVGRPSLLYWGQRWDVGPRDGEKGKGRTPGTALRIGHRIDP